MTPVSVCSSCTARIAAHLVSTTGSSLCMTAALVLPNSVSCTCRAVPQLGPRPCRGGHQPRAGPDRTCCTAPCQSAHCTAPCDQCDANGRTHSGTYCRWCASQPFSAWAVTICHNRSAAGFCGLFWLRQLALRSAADWMLPGWLIRLSWATSRQPNKSIMSVMQVAAPPPSSTVAPSAMSLYNNLSQQFHA